MRAKLPVAVTLCAALSAGPKVLVAQSGAVGPKCLELAVGAASIPPDTINSFPPGEYVGGIRLLNTLSSDHPSAAWQHRG